MNNVKCVLYSLSECFCHFVEINDYKFFRYGSVHEELEMLNLKITVCLTVVCLFL